MIEIIASILFFGSSAGAIAIAAKKMPARNQLPELAYGDGFLGLIKGWFIEKIRRNRYLKDFSWIDLAQKTLLKFKLLALKTENKINEYMIRLRQRAENQKQKEEARLDNYWHDIKTMVKTKKSLGLRDDGLAGKGNQLSVSEAVGAVNDEPMVQRVAMPAQPSEKISNPKKKRFSNSKNRKFRDPFRW